MNAEHTVQSWPLADVPRTAAPKAARLGALLRAGFPVPPGHVFEAMPDNDTLDKVTTPWRTLGQRTMVRQAQADEDSAHASHAGMGTSIGGLTNVDAIVHAWPREMQTGDAVLVQAEIAWSALLVAAWEQGAWFVEVHTTPHPLSSGATPVCAHTADAFDAPYAPALRTLLARLETSADPAWVGLDVELVVDETGALWIVQLRPLVRAVTSLYRPFKLAAGAQWPSRGTWALDAEHNPAPLSVAHAWLVQTLAQRDATLPASCVVYGWLYAEDAPSSPTAEPADDPRPRLQRLLTHDLPFARQARQQLQHALTYASSVHANEMLRDAFACTHQAIARHVALGTNLPARSPHPPEQAPGFLALRDHYRDVLPLAWDIASPTLADTVEVAPPAPFAPPAFDTLTAQEAVWILREWDDLLFACGLSCMRLFHGWAAAQAGAPQALAFLYTANEWVEVLTGARSLNDALAHARQTAWDAQRQALPPPRIEHGRACPVPRIQALHGIAMGPSVDGTVLNVTDLAHLASSEVHATSVVVLPTLTAQAAVVLRARGVRAVCTEHGGALGHGALMARELGLSALLGCRDCTKLATGTHVHLNTQVGRLLVVPSG